MIKISNLVDLSNYHNLKVNQFSLIYNYYERLFYNQYQVNKILTLQPSQVIAPKCTPDEGALQTEHGNPLNNSATVGLLGLSIFNLIMFILNYLN